MNTDAVVEKNIAHRGSSAFLAEVHRTHLTKISGRNIVWPATTINKRPNKKSIAKPQAKPNVDRQNPDGNAALHFAAFNGELGRARLLLAAGASTDVRNGRGDTPLLCAAYNGHCNLLMALIAAGAEIDAKDEDGRTALTWAVIRGHADAVRLLISLGADLTVCDNVDNTPLIWSIIYNRCEICEILVEAEEKLNIR